jgi:type II secretory pathway component PulC
MLPGKLGDVGTLPSGAGVGDNPMAPSATPAEKPFGYRVVGAITGDRSAVVLQDSSGNQKLVPEGSAIDGESRVRRVENGAVWIEYRGKKLRVTVGGISVDKK